MLHTKSTDTDTPKPAKLGHDGHMSEGELCALMGPKPLLNADEMRRARGR